MPNKHLNLIDPENTSRRNLKEDSTSEALIEKRVNLELGKQPDFQEIHSSNEELQINNIDQEAPLPI